MAYAYERVNPVVQKVLAPNPGPMTLDGTNTWVIGDHDRVIIDPGPLDEDHLDRVLAACGGPAAAVLITHRHHDHTDGAARMAELAGCAVRAADAAFATSESDRLLDGQRIDLDGPTLQVVATPGHTSDSTSFLLTSADAPAYLITGDMVLGRGTTVITYPDGDLGAYLESLQTMIEIVDRHQVAEILPGHGDRVIEPAKVLQYYRRHRLERLDQVRSARAAGDRTATEIVRRVYAGVDPSVWPAAEQSVRAQLDYLDTVDDTGG
ncbi:MBL fold metallo-hydrolase [Microlunatus endophyticus]|uniref:MBL fold metallo-hydrolase n=1 Tax=Microlunatus endophyticus TaxID=1716077 RepID=A0A917W9G5_9ACTN|nr:MBL fold metallo-hydrolase [Microlunatus endophyticus]GGL81068.1 MBL fold metallo-hydrolase [Microlunatus endophyticus]